ncbi:MAG: hypothetical protein JO115_19245 [Pseudonocardiales bacterium]|nr:hypothetical protein [Pseudonocardiales bacterium]
MSTPEPPPAELAWYVRSLAPRDVHRGVFTEGSVHAVCGTKFFPQRDPDSDHVRCIRLPQGGQVCPACLAQANGQVVVIPATCSRHPDATGVLELVVRGLGDGRIELEAHPGDGCVLTVDAALVLDVLGTWLG